MSTFNDANHYASILFRGESYQDPSIKYPKIEELTFTRTLTVSSVRGQTRQELQDPDGQQGRVATQMEDLLSLGYQCVDAPEPIETAYVLYAHHDDGACSELNRTAEVSLDEGNWGSMWQFTAASDREAQDIVLDWRKRMRKLGDWAGGEYGTLMVQRMPANADPNADDVNKILPDEGWGEPIICPVPSAEFTTDDDLF
jgi:hypothetical protein